jgi:hypothetical protein
VYGYDLGNDVLFKWIF